MSDLFHPFSKEQLIGNIMPDTFTLILLDTPHPLCLLAATELQEYLKTQQDWEHNFGLNDECEEVIIGKMFGVMVVQKPTKEIGYLCAFSGKIAGKNNHNKFVPPIFDTLASDGFLPLGMNELAAMTVIIKDLQTAQPKGFEERVTQLKNARREYSKELQQQIFNNYFCLNQKGISKDLQSIFKLAQYKNPPAGAAECATPKLLQYAFLNQLKPIAVAEFWWGQSPKSTTWKHGEFYACCKEKCKPILAHMLSETKHTFC
ncbi:pseudouridylate synthase [Bacteroidetes bacterium UKL13-3]|jgi:tRNA pseudouridine32 synthase/23S rRNA pseudouridine746 synthase|nr:pseudouridylate synthase [Bacteroidetes bacterium UKL13-3]HCP94862.1 pseudouridylate synthase [Bacteroidota bacterium]